MNETTQSGDRGFEVEPQLVEHELNRMLLRWLPVTMGSAALAALFIPAVLVGRGMDRGLLTWAAIIIACNIIRWRMGRRVDQTSTVATRQGVQLIFLFSALITTVWVWLAMQPVIEAGFGLMLVTLIVVSLTTGAASAYAAAPKFYLVFAWPVIGTLALRFALGGTDSGATVALILVVFMIASYLMMRRNHDGLRLQIEARLVSARLLKQMTVLNQGYESELTTRRRTQRQLIERDEVLHDMYRVVSNQQVSDLQRLSRLLDLGCRHFGVREAAILRRNAEQVIAIASSGDQHLLQEEGLPESILEALQVKGHSIAVADVEATTQLATELATPIGCLAAVRVNGVPQFTAVCFLDSEVRSEWSNFDHDLLEILSNWIGLEVGRQSMIEDLRNGEQEMRNLANALPFSVSYMDRDLRYQFVNQTFAERENEPAESVIGQTLKNRVSEDTFRKLSDAITGVLCGEAQEFQIDVLDDDPVADYQINYLPDTRGGEVVGFYQIIVDITKAKREQELLEHRATHDALTDLPNRSEMEYQIQRLIDRRGPAGPHSICYVDLDNFKPINDSLGHHAGDVALHWFGQQLRAVSRSSDIVGRIGGDEFALLLPGCPGGLARRITEGLHSLLEATPFEFEGSLFSLRASIGVIEFRGGQGSPSELLKKADAVCYRAKQSGGGRTA